MTQSGWSFILALHPIFTKITSDANVTFTNLPDYFFPRGVCADSYGNIYISDGNGNKIYRYSTNGILSVFAGSGDGGHIDGNGIFSSFGNLSALATDAADNIYVGDSGGQLIRRIDQNQSVTTIVGGGSGDGFGTSAGFNVIGIVSAKLDAATALATSGALPENVNYAVKSSFLLSFLESVPAVDAKLKAVNTAEEKFSDAVKSAEKATVLVLVY